MLRRPLLLLLPASLLLASAGCEKEGCLDPSVDDCTVPSPCVELEPLACGGGSVAVSIVASADEVPGGLDALGSPGDVRLENDKVVAIIDALDHPHYLAPTGGAILDLSTVGDDNDSLRHFFQAVGVLPEEGVTYTDLRLIEEDGLAAVQLRGTLAARPDIHVATRYEVRPCESGVRIRTELVQMEPDASSISLLDAFYLGDREQMAFAPGPGFEHPSFGLSTLGDATVGAPWMAAAAHSDPAASYATVACNLPEVWGFRSNNIATNGAQARPIPYGDYQVFERFLAVAEGPSVASVGNMAMDARVQLFEEAHVLVEGVVAIDGEDRPVGEGLRASVHIREAGEDGAAWSHQEVGDDGRFAMVVPANGDYVIEVESYAVRGPTTAVTVEGSNVDVGVITIPAVGQVTLTGGVDGVSDHLQVLVYPADDTTAEGVTGSMFGAFGPCGPMLGSPYGGSPACNRVLLEPGEATTVGILPGRYDFFAVAGPFSTLAMARDVVVQPGQTATVDLQVETLQMLPGDAMSGDFHVHGGASFDSNMPDDSRVRAWLAARLDVLATTEHDTAWNYAEARDRLGADDRLRVMVGTESTGHILWKILPDNPFPQVIGHWNMWPIPFDPEGAWRGAPWDELVEPGQLFDRAVAQGWDPDAGVAQLNHPIEALLFARDQGYASALGIDGTVPLPAEFDGTPESTFLYTPPGASFANSDYDTQEVMNSSNNHRLQQHRAFWFYLLNQGILRAATANSDSHTLVDSVVGTPRTIVYSPDTQDDFDASRFNGALKDGRALGTNGPVISVAVTTGEGVAEPSLTPVTPDESGVLELKVAAAPWVPVDEVRVIVNGVEARVFSGGELAVSLDPLGTEAITRLDASVPLSELLDGFPGDAWIVVEAGSALPIQADLDCDGFPDTGDNNGDGIIDWQDVEGLDEAPGDDVACLEDTGPLAHPPEPERDAAGYPFWAVTPGGYPMSFTNPLVLDRDGDGEFTGPGVAR